MKGSNNRFPSLLLTAQAATPALTTATGAMVAGQFRLFLDQASGTLKLVDYQGNVTSQFPAGATGTIYYQDAAGHIAALPIGTNGQFLSVAAGLPAWVAAPTGGGSGVVTTFTRVSDGDTNGLFYYLGQKAGGGSWVNPYGTTYLGVTASGGQFQGNTSNLGCATDRQIQSGTGQYDCVILGDNSNPCWIQFDLGSTRTMVLSSVAFENRGPYNSNGSTVYVPCNQLTAAGSNDGSTWTTVGVMNISDQSPSHWTTGGMEGTTGYRYLRFTATGDGGTGGLAIGELEVYGALTTTAGPTDALLTGTPIGSPPYSDMYALAHAFDGDSTTEYAGSGTSGQYIGMDFGSSKTVNKVSIFPRTGSQVSLQSVQIQSSTDGSTWANTGNTTPASVPEHQYTTFTLTSPIVGRYIRILGAEGSRADCSEIQFLGH